MLQQVAGLLEPPAADVVRERLARHGLKQLPAVADVDEKALRQLPEDERLVDVRVDVPQQRGELLAATRDLRRVLRGRGRPAAQELPQALQQRPRLRHVHGL